MRLSFIAATVLALILTAPVRADEETAPPEATLSILNRDVITFRASVASSPPSVRVERARDHLSSVTDTDLTQPIAATPFSIGDNKGVSLQLGDRMLFSVMEGDVDPTSGLTFDELVDRTRLRLEDIQHVRRDLRQWPHILEGIIRVVASSAVLGGLLFIIWRVLDKVAERFARASDETRTRGGRAYWEQYLKRLTARLLQLVLWIIAAITFYTWITYALESFLLTEPLGLRLKTFIVGLLLNIISNFVDALPNLATIVVILFITRAVVDVVMQFLTSVQRRRVEVSIFHPETVSATKRIVAIMLWAFGLAVAYPFIPGSNSDVFKGLSVLIGLMISLGSAGIVSQVMSGLSVVYARALRRGDYVRVNDIEGFVTEIGALATKIVTRQKEEVTIPNAVLIGTSIHNYTKLAASEPTYLSTKITIGYDAPWRQVHAMLTMAAERTAGLLAAPAPYVLQRALSDFYVEYELFAHIAMPAERVKILSDLHGNIQDVFNEYGVQIMSPNFRAQPDGPVLSPKEKWFEAPASPDAAPDKK